MRNLCASVPNNCFVCNYTTDLCNGDLQSTITIFKHTVFSNKTDWTFTNSVACLALLCFAYLACLALPCLLYGNVNRLMNVLEGECSRLCFLDISRNVNIVISYSSVFFSLFTYYYFFMLMFCWYIFVYLFIKEFLVFNFCNFCLWFQC